MLLGMLGCQVMVAMVTLTPCWGLMVILSGTDRHATGRGDSLEDTGHHIHTGLSQP